MKQNRKKYQLTEKALDGVLDQTDVNATIDLNENGKKGNTYMIIEPTSGETHYIIPYKYNGDFYAAYFPNPVELFFRQAIEHKTSADLIVKSFQNNVDHVYNQGENSIPNIKMVNPEIFDLFIIYKISCLTALSSTIEAFTNECIPEHFKILNKKNIEVGKEEVERTWDLKSKLKQVLPELYNLDDREYVTLVDRFIEMNYLRNEFVHMKFKNDAENIDPYLDNFQKLINLDLNKTVIDIRALINFVRTKYQKQ